MSPLISSVATPPAPTTKSMSTFPQYNGLQKCPWKPGDGLEGCPHRTFGRTSKSSAAGSGNVVNSALELVGSTPMVKLERIMEEFDLPCELWAKAEYFNPGGSVKDRIALRMIEAAEEEGRIRPGDTLIEPTSGNTGTGLCLAAAIKGYKMVVTMPEKMSGEKVNMMKCLGAEILRTPNEAAWNTPESHIGLAIKLQREIPRSHILDQYLNPANPMAHYEGTGAEIIEQCDGKVDVMVLGAGTGGTITGVARKLKDVLGDQCLVVGVDPVGSILAVPDSLNDPGRLEGYQVEGIGYDFIPTVLDRDPSVIDEWMKVGDPEALAMARKLIRLEGLTVGGSSGTCVAAAVRYIKSKTPEEIVGKRVVTLLPDSSRNYMSKVGRIEP
ncbi:Cystathionine beta-synthase, putative [Perkinsus marinus ATCC 50983]|uniref:cystathionine beta-synthase n=1 Tax=Perkinsus marinus (strain ATCC 50983 / TXsc) TaxID=423536 RepID=C5K8R7_PERM5|nr:Cystathionine beta-synthase, putative [Perkinsus marinus ATCC 50983]EER19144.1 Cystathionine beta-synthase, putative [Perkinsus marinus ATCC 50983]|eukprot:XP_002787348.1 Cystathionine beta-synthase, putative [Perkinsus marinus ATCC 50983]